MSKDPNLSHALLKEDGRRTRKRLHVVFVVGGVFLLFVDHFVTVSLLFSCLLRDPIGLSLCRLVGHSIGLFTEKKSLFTLSKAIE